MNKKLLIAIAIFFLSSVTLFVFAEPANDDELTGNEEENPSGENQEENNGEDQNGEEEEENQEEGEETGGTTTPAATPQVVFVDNVKPVIALVGDALVEINLGETFVDPGVTATDDVDGDISTDVVAGGDTIDNTTVGDYTLTYNVSDDAGNAADEVVRVVRVVDPEAPVISLVGDSSIKLEVGMTYTEQGATATDNYDPVVTVIQGGDSVDTTQSGVYVVTYDATDSEGNHAIQVTRTVTVVAKNPLKPIFFDKTDSNMTDIGNAWEAPGYTPGVIEADSSATYEDWVYARSYDEYDDVEYLIGYDLPCMNGHSDCYFIKYKVDKNDQNEKAVSAQKVDLSIPGSYYIGYRVWDTTGNTTYRGRWVDVVDTTAPAVPTVDLNGYAEGTWANDRVTWYLSSTDNSTPSDEIQFQIQYAPGGTWYNYSYKVSFMGSYNWNVAFRAIDKSGNISESTRSYNIKIDIVAPSVPTVDFNGYVPGDWTDQAVDVTLLSTDHMSGVSHYQYQLDNDGNWFDMGANITFYDNYNSLIKFRAVDNAGNTSEATNNYELKIDLEAPAVPTVDLNGYIEGTWANDRVTWYLSSTDNSTPSDQIQFQIQYAPGGTWYNYSYKVSFMGNYNWNVAFRAIDQYGHISESTRSYNIKQDIVAPSVPTVDFNGYVPGTTTAGDITITLSSTDNKSGISHYQYQLDSNGNWINTSSTLVIDYEISADIKFRAVDNAGNVSGETNEYELNVIHDNFPPVITLRYFDFYAYEKHYVPDTTTWRWRPGYYVSDDVTPSGDIVMDITTRYKTEYEEETEKTKVCDHYHYGHCTSWHWEYPVVKAYEVVYATGVRYTATDMSGKSSFIDYDFTEFGNPNPVEVSRTEVPIR